MRQRNAWVSARAPGYHLNGRETRSASWPRARSSVTSSSVKISARPRANGTCGRRTAIRIRRLARVRGAMPRELRLQCSDPRLAAVDQTQRSGIEGALVVRERLDVPAHQLAQDGLDRRPEPTPEPRAQPQRAVRTHGTG